MEFVCPDGIRAAVYRQQIIAALDNGIVVAALRFYIKKNRETASLYQFAIQEPYRGKRLLAQMLGLLEIPHVLAQCKEDSIFNDYYMKTGWTRIKTERNLTTWSLDNTSKSIMTTSPQYKAPRMISAHSSAVYTLVSTEQLYIMFSDII